MTNFLYNLDITLKEVIIIGIVEQKTLDDTEFVDLFIESLSQNQLVSLVKILNLKIPGFSKSARNAPIQLIKKPLKKEIVLNLNRFLKSFLSKELKQYEKMEEEFFLTKVNMDDSLSNPHTLGLYAYLFSESYIENEEKIKGNIKQKKDPLINIVHDNDIPFEIKLRAYHNIIENQENLWEVIIRQFPSESLNTLKKQGDNLKDFISENLGDENEDFFLRLFYEKEEEWKSWSTEEKEAFFQLTLLNLAQHHEKLIKNEKKELETLTKTNKQTNDKLKKKVSVIDHMSKTIDDLEKKIHQLSIENHLLNNDVQEIQLQLENKTKEKNKSTLAELELNKQVKELTNEIKETQKKNVTFDLDPLIERENICLFTKKDYTDFSSFLTEEQCIKFNKIEELSSLFSEENWEGWVVFIDQNTLSTKELFTIDRTLKKNKIIHKKIEGNTQKLIRQIIFFLEGDLRYETH